MRKQNIYTKIGSLILLLLVIYCKGNNNSIQKGVKIKSISIFTNKYHFFMSPQEEEKLRLTDTLFLFKFEEYDSLGNLVEDKLLNGDISYHEFYQNIYDSCGKLIKRHSSNFDDFRNSSIDTFIYSNNVLIEEINFHQNGDKLRNVKYEYDNMGNKVYMHLWDRRSGSYWTKTSFNYKNRLLTNEKGEFYYKNYTYNDKDLVIGEFLFYNSPDTVTSISYKYNPKNQLVQYEILDHRNNSVKRVIKTYNNNGLVSKVFNDNETFTYDYEYF